MQSETTATFAKSCAPRSTVSPSPDQVQMGRKKNQHAKGEELEDTSLLAGAADHETGMPRVS